MTPDESMNGMSVHHAHTDSYPSSIPPVTPFSKPYGVESLMSPVIEYHGSEIFLSGSLVARHRRIHLSHQYKTLRKHYIKSSTTDDLLGSNTISVTSSLGVCHAAGYSREGMAHAFLSGRALALHVLDRKDEAKDWLPECMEITETRWKKACAEDLIEELWG